MTLVEFYGWAGAACLLFAFGMNILNKEVSETPLYLLLNLIGSALLALNAYMNNAFPFVVVNVVWILFSAYKLVYLAANKSK